MNKLPRGWAQVKLQEVSVPNRPRRLPKEFQHLQFVGMEHVESGTRKLLGTIDATEVKSSAFHFQPGDVLYGRLRPYLNKVFCADREGLCSSEFIVFPEQGVHNPQYLAMVLGSSDFVEFANSLNKGDRPRVSYEQIADYDIPLPPLREQDRIVRKVLRLARIGEACNSRFDKVPTLIKRFRQSAFAAACSGKLTENWRKISSLKSTGFERSQHATSSGHKAEEATLPPSWALCPLGELCDIVTKGASPKWQGLDYVDSGTLFITSENIGHATLLLTHPKYVDEKINRIQSRSILQRGDLLLNIVGASIGRCALYDCDHVANINQAVALIRLKEPHIKQYVLFALNSPQLIDQMNEMKVDVARANLSLTDVKAFLIPLPPISEQIEIVRRVRQLFSLTEQLEARYSSAKNHITSLQQAILAKAFRGELVQQDPDDEPASALLKRIQAARKSEVNPNHIVKVTTELGMQEVEVSMLKRKDILDAHLTTILKDHGPLSPENLWRASQLEIDDFYDQLKDENAKGLLREVRNKSGKSERLLEAVA